MKTPEGIYYFRRTLSGNELPKIDDYGEKAFTMNFPNPIDKLENRKGSGIWLHGANDSNKVRTANSSRGCIVMNNNDLNKVSKYVFLNETPIFIYNTLKFSTQTEIEKKRDDFLRYIKKWKTAWEKKALDEYINSYNSRFRNNGMDLRKFKNYKKRLNRIYKFIRVKLSDITIYSYKNHYFASFNQLYISDRNHFYSKKIQYWNTSNNRPKIAYEKSIPLQSRNKIEISKGNYITIDQFRKNILKNKEEIVTTTPSSSMIQLNSIILDKIEKKTGNVNLTINKIKNIEQLKTIPVLLLKNNDSSIYRSLDNISLKNGIPQNTEDAISLTNKNTSISVPTRAGYHINSVSLFIFDKRNNFKQILTYFINN